MPNQRSLDLPRLDPEPAQLDLTVRTTQKVQHPVRTPARKVPGAVHPAPRSTKRVRNKPLRRQPRTPQIAPRKPRPRNVKLPANPSRYRLQVHHPAHTPACSRSDGRSAGTCRHQAAHRMKHRSCCIRRLGRAVSVDHRARPMPRPRAQPCSARTRSRRRRRCSASAGRLPAGPDRLLAQSDGVS